MDAAFYEPYTDLRTLVDPTCVLCRRDLSRQTPCDLLMWYPEGHLGPMLLIGLVCERCSATASESGEWDPAEIVDLARARRRRHLHVGE
jgi:hypothetical protein